MSLDIYDDDGDDDDTEEMFIVPCFTDDFDPSDLRDRVSFLTAPTAAPIDVTVRALNSSSVSVGWSKPNKIVLHGMVRTYELQYRRVECVESDPVSVTNSSWRLVAVANSSLSQVISGLVFWSCYEFRVRAVTVGNGPFSDIKHVRTKEHGLL